MGRAARASAAVIACGIALAPSVAHAARPGDRMIERVNDARKARGVPPLRSSRSLSRSAARYARTMLRRQFFGHSARIFASRRFRRLGETLERHRGLRARIGMAVRLWLRSPSHRRLLLSRSYRYLGAGRARGRLLGRRTTMWVLHFGAR
jgi:uncharacterized protein YkwD